MRIAVIIQARMNSERLPGKVLSPVLGRPLLEYQIDRVERVDFPHELVIATTLGSADDPLASFCKKKGVACYRGSENDVLARTAEAAATCSAEAVVRLTGDCPLTDPKILDHVVGRFLERAGRVDYVSNVLRRTYPRGLDCEVFTRSALESAHKFAALPAEREHVTLYIYSRPERFRLMGVENAVDESLHRWTVDTAEDLELVRRILTELYPADPKFEMNDVLKLLAVHPDWASVNRAIQQKGV